MRWRAGWQPLAHCPPHIGKRLYGDELGMARRPPPSKLGAGQHLGPSDTSEEKCPRAGGGHDQEESANAAVPSFHRLSPQAHGLSKIRIQDSLLWTRKPGSV